MTQAMTLTRTRGTKRATKSSGRGRAVIILAAVAVLALAGAAAAPWGSTGGGSAAATSATTSALTLSPATPAAQLYPGGQAGVVLTVTNPNPASIRVGSLALDTTQGSSGFGVDAGHSGCGLATLSFATQTNGGAGWTVPGSGSLSVTLTDALSMGTGAASACQGAAFTVYLKVAS
jgi:hypothetical protein